MAQSRLQSVVNHLTGGSSSTSTTSSGLAKLQVKHADDVVITSALRMPLCKAGKGGYKDTSSDELLLELFKAAKANIGIDAGTIGDICVGTVLTANAPYSARAAALTAGFPDNVPIQIINRFCSSGLMAVSTISNQIRNGEIEIGLALGYESMTANKDGGSKPLSDEMMAHPVAKDCIQPMGWTSENVAGDFNISRQRMDEVAAMSHQRAEAAQQNGVFASEIVPIQAYGKTPDGKKTRVTISQDDGIRKGSTPETLGKIRAAFPQWSPSNTTGGNASQITDGGAFVLMMTRRKAEQLGLTILAKHVATSVSGLAPRIMGIGPTYAIPAVLKRTGLSVEEVDLFEINEAFASMYVYCLEKLKLDPAKVNVNGGAIALGHPLGATGARQVATGLNALKRRKGKVLVTSMCIGLGMGAAAVFIAE